MIQGYSAVNTPTSGDENKGQSGQEKIFLIKKYNRNGLFEKKIMRNGKTLRTGKWSKEEHNIFLQAILKYGAKWKKIKEEISNRTLAQIRSHAQKYLIKLCKKYNIEIKSKRKASFTLSHLNFPYKRKTMKHVLPLEKISKVDLRLIRILNFYKKNVNLDLLSEKIFQIKKVPKAVVNEEEELTSEKDNKIEEIVVQKKLSSNASQHVSPYNQTTFFNKNNFLIDKQIEINIENEKSHKVGELNFDREINSVYNSNIKENVYNLNGEKSIQNSEIPEILNTQNLISPSSIVEPLTNFLLEISSINRLVIGNIVDTSNNVHTSQATLRLLNFLTQSSLSLK